MITLWHNPRCSKSRQALALLRDAGADVAERRYLEDAPSANELRAVLAMLGRPPRDLLRKNEPEYKAAGLGPDSSDTEIVAALVQHPKLIERPVAILGDRAVIGRPPEDVLALVQGG